MPRREAPCLSAVLALATLQLLCGLAAARLDTGTVLLGADHTAESGWQYISKFGFGYGNGTWQLRVKAPQRIGPLDVDMELFLDEDWARVAKMPPCSAEARELARMRVPLRAGGAWADIWRGNMRQNMRPHIWYFALSSCGKGYYATETVDFELHFLQADSSELSFELRHMPGATFLAVLCLSAFLVRFAVRCRHIKERVGEVHPVILVLAGAALIQWLSQVLYLLHLQLHEKQGVGESGLEASADMLFMLSQVMSSTLFIVVANGFALLSSRCDELTAARPTAAVIALLHVALVCYSKLLGDHADKHHENGGVAGLGLVAVRVLLWLCFMLRIEALRKHSPRLEGVLRRFRLAGSLYFLAYPVIYVLAQAFAAYLQHPIMHISLVVMQSIAAFGLSSLFLSKSDFFQVSSLNSSLLPGGMGCGGGKLD